jgi:hypothetical protein
MKNAENLFENLWKSLSTRQQEVLSGRFGLLKYKKPQTLAALGKKYGITRERVRQIESVALKSLKEKILATPEFVSAFEAAKKHLKGLGGVAPKNVLLEHLSGVISGLTENHLALLLDSTNAFHYRGDNEEFYAFYYSDPAALKAAEAFISQWLETLRKNRDEVLAGGYEELFKKFVKTRTLSPGVADNYASLSRLLHENPYGDRGLAEWPEIRPTTIRDRIYLVLKKAGEPMHFQTIAQTINKAGFGSRTALAPTVHNEVIKDSRFVLVGRGIYGLSESGFQPGTAREVIHRILKSRGPLKPREVILAVQKERFLKPNTVLVNLQNKQFFQRNGDGSYGVREA